MVYPFRVLRVHNFLFVTDFLWVITSLKCLNKYQRVKTSQKPHL